MQVTQWIKSSLSFANSNCVEVSMLADGQVVVRNSRFSDFQLPPFTPAEWRAFLGGVRAGEFDLEPGGASIEIEDHPA